MQVNEFSFGGIESSRFYITCDTETHFILPEQRQYVTEIPGADGYHDFGIRSYGTRVITKTIYFDGDYAFLRANEDQIAAWLANDGEYKKLIFGDRPDRFYMAKVVAALDLTNAKNRKIGSIQFVCNPPWAYSNEGLALTPEYYKLINSATDNTQFVLEIDNSPTVMRIYNVGSNVKPVIKLIGYNPNQVQLSVGEQMISFGGTTDTFDGFVIDCESETVVRMSDGEDVYSLMTGEFITLPHGYSEIIFSSAGAGQFPQSLTVIIEFTPVYGG